MDEIAVTGAAGSVGRRVVDRLVSGESELPARVVALDRRGPGRKRDGVSGHRLDLAATDPAELAAHLTGCRSIVHLAEDDAARQQETDQARASALGLLENVLAAADLAGCRHLVLLSSALVYGAHADNPVPLTEQHRARPEPTLAFAMVKSALEQRATRWAEETGSALAVLRPAATLSKGDSSWVGAAIRAAAAVRPEGIDPPVQFLHHDDLADAVTLAAVARFDGLYNVAPDGWIGTELFRGLRGEAQVRLPEPLDRWRTGLARAAANRTVLDGLTPYITHPWVVANDKIRAEGWEPAYSNAEAYVAGTAPPVLSSIAPTRRQELALGLVGAAGTAVVGATIWAARRALDQR